jgi:AraC-like DNA-binding protein
MMRKDLSRTVALGHAGCSALLSAGLRGLGIDYRAQGSAWGEGLSSTHLLFLVLDGTVAHERGDPAASAGEWLLVPPNVPKRLTAPAGSCRAVFIHFGPESPCGPIFDQMHVQPASMPERFEAILEGLIAETMSQADEAESVVRPWSDLLLHYLSRRFPHSGSSHEVELRQRLDRLWNDVKAALDQPWDVQHLAELACMSPGHFHRSVRRIYLRRPVQMLRRLRLERAADLLRTTNLPLDAIAAQVGYATGFSLSNAMRRELGHRPMDVRSPEQLSQRTGGQAP